MISTDVSAWEPAGEEYLGTKPKQWLRSREGNLWLWKESTFNLDSHGKPYRKGDDWAEVVAGRVGLRRGVPVATVELAGRGERLGVVSKRVFDDDTEVLVHGNELLAEIGVVGHSPRDRSGYTLEAVKRVLEDAGPPVADTDVVNAFDWFAGYVVLDALIGNTDRHQDSWATIRSGASQRLAPSFDHASSLGFLLSDEQRAVQLTTKDRNRTVAAYADVSCTSGVSGVTRCVALHRTLSVESWACGPDALGVAELRRAWHRQREDPAVAPYAELAEPDLEAEPDEVEVVEPFRD